MAILQYLSEKDLVKLIESKTLLDETKQELIWELNKRLNLKQQKIL